MIYTCSYYNFTWACLILEVVIHTSIAIYFEPSKVTKKNPYKSNELIESTLEVTTSSPLILTIQIDRPAKTGCCGGGCS